MRSFPSSWDVGVLFEVAQLESLCLVVLLVFRQLCRVRFCLGLCSKWSFPEIGRKYLGNSLTCALALAMRFCDEKDAYPRLASLCE